MQSSLNTATEFTDILKHHNNKIHEQLHNLVQNTQQYMDRWFDLGVQALYQTKHTIINGWQNSSVPLSNALKAWASDVQDIISNPTESPLKIVTIHHWDQLINWIHKHDKIIETMHLDFNEHLQSTIGDVQTTLLNFAEKVGVDNLVESCEEEIKDMWLSWHLQFMPTLE